LKIVVTGSQGMLGWDLCARLDRNHHVSPLTRADADIIDPPRIAELIRQASPDVVIHTAAFTAVDRCESKRDLAFRVNGTGTRNVTWVCKDLAIPLVYLSTDYVFDGEKNEPYLETDAPHPLSVYGESKLEGGRHVRTHLKSHWIVRTSWLFGPHGRNFVGTILDQAKRGAPLRVISDQIGSPTYPEDLAAGLEAVLQGGGTGIYHISNQDTCSRFDFSQEILRQAGFDPSQIIPIATSTSDRPARRPRNSRLAGTHLAAEGLPLLPSWQDAVHRYLVRTGEIRY
jgi:dTDP-4-dehydrorhamnose reductase